ncbi:MAG: hypothetical protein A3G34_03935 [Candidatus Lindowbacteria bacterium RIFCSPLOWO2_12_FULL_62_27]|nr:MAG: hypothetical protein A3G34_03935 [Candidatus Lindowbacteria bacterium RIFCSPLOWO2_12_FULL_62_27]OGH63647.1 MAG: hypothetical protein A3I06_14085 [Candidatus Lindowbacteria bacterium RIFCSPLOWO2_02_FULL_62_12]
MVSRDLARKISRRLDIPLKDAQAVLDAFCSAVVHECISVPRVELRGFGTFMAVRRRPRPAYDFRTGGRIRVPDRLDLKFKPGKELTERISPPRSAGL